MIKGLAEKIIKSYCGQFIDGLDSEKLNLSLLKGDVEIKNIRLKQEYFNAMHMPF
jgi:hypothetical protein